MAQSPMHRRRNLQPSSGNAPSFWSDPFREVSFLQRQIDQLFDDFMSPMEMGGGSPWRQSMSSSFNPLVDVEEAGDHYLLSIDLPGMSQEDVRIEVQDNQLMISGERHEEREAREKGRTRYQQERFYGSFMRSFTLPMGVKPEDIQADYRDGVLRIAIPKVQATQGKQIRIGESKPGFFEKLLGSRKEPGEKVA